MHRGRLVFAQLMDLFPQYEFAAIVRRWGGDHRLRRLSCRDQFLAMAFAQLTGRQSLRDIETCLGALGHKVYHAGLRSRVARSTLADANERRPWQIYEQLAQVLIARARPLYAGDALLPDLEHVTYALDATIIELCLALFPWAALHHGQGGIKLHTLLDLRGNLPVSVFVTSARHSELPMLDQLTPEPGAIYVMDRGLVDFLRLYRFHRAGAFFITRPKRNLRWRSVARHPAPRRCGVLADQTIRLVGEHTRHGYPDHLRRVDFFDRDQRRHLQFVTNNFLLPALTIALLYKQRWQIELFFKWIKQHLRIKSFFGTSPNAVKTQIWIAISVYVMVAILKKQLRLNHSLYTMLQILEITLFENTSILQAFSHISSTQESETLCKQLTLFDF